MGLCHIYSNAHILVMLIKQSSAEYNTLVRPVNTATLTGRWLSRFHLSCGLHLDLVVWDLIIDRRQIFVRQVSTVVDAAVHLDVLLFGHLVLHLQKDDHATWRCPSFEHHRILRHINHHSKPGMVVYLHLLKT